MRRDASVGVDLYGRDVSASKALKSVGQSAEKLGHKVNDTTNKIIKGMALAAAAAAAVAVKIGVDAVKAAAEDAKSVTLLEKAIHNSTKATAAQTKAVEDYINKAQLRYNFEDTKLRGGMGRLVAATHNVSKAQKLLMFSMNLSAKSGKDLDTVTMAVSKAYAGNLGALSRLGVAIPKALLKTKDFGKVIAYVETQVKGFAATAADTFEGRLGRAKLAIDEAKESLGYMLLPYVERFATLISTKVVPALQKWIDENGPRLRKMFDDAAPKVESFLTKMVALGSWAYEHKDALKDVAVHLAAIVVAIKAGVAVTKTIAAIKLLIATYNALKLAAAGAVVAEAAATGGVSLGPAIAAAVAAAAAFGVTEFALNGGFDKKGSAGGGGNGRTLAGTNFGSVSGQYAYGSYAATAGTNVTINVQGSVVHEKDLVNQVRNAITQANRRQGADVTVVGKVKK